MIWLLLLTAGVLVLYRGILVARSRPAAPKPARLPETEEWRWGRGVWALVLGREMDRGIEAEVAEALLAVSWRVADAADLDEAERVMRSRFPELDVWRAVRMMAFVRLAVAGRLITPGTGTDRLGGYASLIRDRVGSWEELGATFQTEHAAFLAATAEAREVEVGMARLPDAALLSRSRAWLADDLWQELTWE